MPGGVRRALHAAAARPAVRARGAARHLGVDGPRRDVFAATLDALRRTPTVAVLEDVHWADEATLDLIRFLGRRLEQTTTLLIATYRDDELGLTHPLRVVLGDVPSGRARRASSAVRARGEGPCRRLGRRPRRALPADRRESVLRHGGAGGGRRGRARERSRRGARSCGEAEPPGPGDRRRRCRGREACGAGAARARPRRAAGGARGVPGRRGPPGRGERGVPARAARRAVEEAIDPSGGPSCTGASWRRCSRGERTPLGSRTTPRRRATPKRWSRTPPRRPSTPSRSALTAKPPPSTPGRCASPTAYPRRAVAELLEARAYECYLTDQVEDALATQLEAREHYRRSETR